MLSVIWPELSLPRRVMSLGFLPVVLAVGVRSDVG